MRKFGRAVLGKLLLAILLLLAQRSSATVETIPTGSYIINMGITPQTVGNGLKPYGLVYDLLKNYSVPVKWVINASKPKDGVDFIFNSVSYKGGTFIIPASSITAAVQTRINFWITQGVVTTLTASAFSADVSYTLKIAPRWVLDAANGNLAVPFFTNAGIPSSAYIFKDPTQLGNCDDIYVMPHATPTWNTHKNLYYWNLSYKGAIWAGCNAVSNMENSSGPDINNGTITRRMNFLMQDGPAPNQNAVSFLSHSAGSPPYTQINSGHPVMQFMGKTDNAQLSGFETVYMPDKAGGWRPGTFIGAYDPTQTDIPSMSWGPAAAIVFGRGFSDPNRGWVLYEGSHSIAGTGSDNVAAQRAFYNFSFLAALDKLPVITLGGNLPDPVLGGTTSNLTVAATSPTGSGGFTYLWSSSCGGTFSNATSTSTTYTAPSVGSNSTCVITCKVTDNCGRVSFENRTITVYPSQRPPVCAADVATLSTTCGAGSITVNVLANDSDPDGDPLTATLVGNGTNGTFVNNGGGNITYTPNANFYGTDQVSYTVSDGTGRSCTTTLTVTVSGISGTNGCSATQFYGQVDNITALGITGTGSVTNTLNAEADPDGIPGDNTTYAAMAATNDLLKCPMELTLTASGTNVYIFADATVAGTFRVEQSLNGSTWTNPVVFSVTTADDFLESNAKIYTTTVANVGFIRITNLTTGTLMIDAVEDKIFGCVSAIPFAEVDAATTLEDMPVVINVLGNDNDPQNLPLTITGITSQPANGKVSINPDGTITYLNLKDQPGSGTDAFAYNVCNTTGFCATAIVTVTIVKDLCGPGLYKTFDFNIYTAALNPSADSYIKSKTTNGNYGAITSMYIKGKSNDRKRTLVNFNLSAIPANAIIDAATLQLYKTSGSAETVGIYRLTTAWTEGNVTWVKATNTVNWTTAGSDAFATLYSSINVGSANSVYKVWDVKSLVQGWVSTTYPNYGLRLLRMPEGSGTRDIIFNSNNAATNKPVLNITYRVPGACTAIPLYAPLSMPDTATTFSTTPVTINVSANDYDYNATGLSVSTILSTSSKGGTVTMSGNNILYTPPATPIVAIDTIRYKICSSSLCDTGMIYVRLINSPPNANADAYTLLSNTATTPNSITSAVLSNDTDPEGASLSAPTITVQPKNGTATVSGNNIIYTPNINFLGNDTLIYSITDISGACSLLSDTALVVYTVGNRAPVATGESFSINPCEAKAISVLTNDVDPEAGVMTVQIVSGPAIGTATLYNNNSQVYYQAPSGVTNTSTTLTYKVCDDATPSLCSNTVTLTINIRAVAVNTAPVAARDTFYINMNETLYADVLSNDTDPDADNFKTPISIFTAPTKGSTVSYANGLIGYIPNLNYVGLDSFQYAACDTTPKVAGCPGSSSLCTNAWVYIAIQNSPIANIDKASTKVGTPVTISVLGNDVFGVNGPALGSITIVSGVAHGTVSVLTNSSTTQDLNQIRYTPTAGYIGIDSLIYQICDTKANCDTAIVYLWVVPDADGDAIADDVDLDDDNDGVPDVVEICGAGATSFSCAPNGTDPSGDDDNDGIVNYKDADYCTLNTAGTCSVLDSDGDGIPDFLDRDSDNDGIPDVIEAGGVDANGDGIIDNFCDTDGDGLSQNVDANLLAAAGSGQGLGATDFDGDGVPNAKDLDSDNDGIPDIVESYGADANNDGGVDSFVDMDGDGWANAYDGDADGNGSVENLTGVLILSMNDPAYVNCASPGTGRPTCYAYRGNADNQGKPNFLDLDSDGDGITDAVESGITTVTYTYSMVSSGTFTNGWSDIIKAMPALGLLNSDNSGRADVYDIDSDNDGVTDNVEAQATNSYVVPTDADTDGDGIADVYDFYNGLGANGLTPFDHDADLIPDYRDVDSDNDGAPDRNEGDQLNAALSQVTIDASGDTDGDGMMNYFDTYNLVPQTCASAYVNVGMSNMGPLGDFNGPIPGGSSVVLNRSAASSLDRDWRNSIILPIQLVQFTANLQGSTAVLHWQVQNESNLKLYKVERSVDAVSFMNVGTVQAKNSSSASYNFSDDVAGLNSSKVYYRITQLSNNSSSLTSNVVRLNIVSAVVVTIYPNPFVDVLHVSMQSKVKESAVISLHNVLGETIAQRTVTLEKGSNNVMLSNLAKLAQGVYIVKIISQQETFTQKVIKE
jgi:hypothetical protein